MKNIKSLCLLIICLVIASVFCGSIINPVCTNAVTLTDTAYPVISKTETKISAPATVIKEIKNQSDLEASGISGAQVAVMDVNSNAKVIFADGGEMSVLNAMNSITGKAIPAFRFNNLTEGNALVSYLNGATENKIYDLFFVCKDSAVLKEILTTYPLARGVLDYSGKDFSSAFDVSSETMKSYSSIAIVDADKIDDIKMDYFKDAYMSIWAETDAADAFNIMKIISSGVNGIISSNQQSVIDCMNKINDVATLVRKATVVGHRGASLDDIADPATSMKIPENSMAAFKYAYKNSADLIELDVMFSSDKELIIMHDDTINRTLNVDISAGSLSVSSLTKEQIQSYEYRNCNEEYKAERVPTLQDVLNEFKDKDLRILIEIKADESGLAKAVADAIKAKNMQNQVSCISFYKNQLKILKDEIPEIAAGILTFTALETTDNIVNVPENIKTINSLLSGGKYAYAPNTGLYNTNLFAQETIRGVLFNGWTYVNAKTRNDHLGYGISALTLDVPQWFNQKLAKVNVEKETMSIDIGEEAVLDITLTTYSGSNMEIDDTRLKPVIISGDAVELQDGKLTAVKSGIAVVVPRYQQAGYTVMGAPIEITVNESNGKSGCGSAASSASILLIALAGLIIAKK